MVARRMRILLALSATGVLLAAPPPPAPEFDKAVQPLLTKSCVPCHNDRSAAGGLNVKALTTPASIIEQRESWEHVLQKVRTGEMPPKGIPRPPLDQVDAMRQYVEAEFDKADRNLKPDPGRVTARRLNRTEYSNTIRDLLGIEFRADKDFPTDDSGYGFDNIGDVLTISPVLMEKYMAAAERLASRAIGADPMPKPTETGYQLQTGLRRLGPTMTEVSHEIEADGEYKIRIGLPGTRGEGAKPVTLALWMDGKLLQKMEIETKPNDLVFFQPFSEEQMKLVLPAGDHVFRIGFIGDEFPKALGPKELFDPKKNKYVGNVTFHGPFPAEIKRPSREKILVCDPKTGDACVTKILATLAHRAYRRPVTDAEVASLVKFVKLSQKEGQSVDQGIQLALQAMLVSPHFLFRIERDPNATDASAVHPISDLELASRLSYFLWSSMPDDALLVVAESGKLHDPAILDAQVKRMLADSRANALGDNFAGQWLETRALDSIKPDPKKFPEWTPELKDAMKTETKMFFNSILTENRPVSDFIDARYTFLNERLAKHYGIDGVSGPDFRRVELSSDQRGGILSQGSILTVSSYPTRTSPVIRGKYVLQNILGTPPPPPPPDVPALDESSVGTAGSVRQQLEKHRANAMCASCHNRMDALGFGLENYDATGKWRTEEGKFKIDSSGTLPSGKSFVGPAELRNILKEDLPTFTHCLTEKMLTYSLGRGLERYDRKTVDEIVRKVEASNYQFQTMIFEVVRSLPFQSRRGEGARKEMAQR